MKTIDLLKPDAGLRVFISGAATGIGAAMAEASRAVLAGFELRTEAKVVRWPDRYMDKRGRQMWDTVSQLVDTTDPIREIAE